jgi:Cdc6-like AAA superfamily ATPase
MDKDEALKLALEALEGWKDDAPSQWSTNDEKLITVLRAALEQQEQEQEPKSTWQKLYEAAIDQRNEAVAVNQELLEALKYHQEQTRPIERTCAAIAKAEGQA